MAKAGDGRAAYYCYFCYDVLSLVLLSLMYVILFVIWWRFRHVIKMMVDVENILNNKVFFGHTVDTPKEGVEQHKKQ